MDVLLDTHTLLWAVDDPTKLGTTAAATLRDGNNTLQLSMASVWEIGIKYGKQKLPLSLPFRQWIDQAIAALDIRLLNITVDHIERQVQLAGYHGDPFDRMIAAQSLVRGIPLISVDPKLDAYGVTRIWN